MPPIQVRQQIVAVDTLRDIEEHLGRIALILEIRYLEERASTAVQRSDRELDVYHGLRKELGYE